LRDPTQPHYGTDFIGTKLLAVYPSLRHNPLVSPPIVLRFAHGGMFKRLTVLLGAILFVLTTGSAAHARDAWISVRSPHLLVIGNGNEKDIRQVAIQLEQFREVVSQLFDNSPGESPVPTTVIVFKDDASYGPFKSSENNAGYFQPGQDVNYITLSTESRGEQDPFNIIFHEYTHLLVNNSIGRTPAWFNEGLAEFYSSLSVDGQKVIIGRPIRRHIAALHQNALLSLRTLLELDYKSPYYNDSNKQTLFYAQSWALMHYLLLNRGGERMLQALRFVKGSDKNLDESFKTAFGTSIENFDNEFRGYVQQDRYRFTEKLLDHKLQTTLPLSSSPVPEAELLAYLGDLLLHSNRAEAETYLQRALALNPDLVQANASLGMLRYKQGKYDEAIVNLERAVGGNSQNALVYYYYASALSHPTIGDTKPTLGYAPEVATKARTALRKAIALRSDFPDSYNLLAYVNLVTSTEIDETIELMKGKLANAPERIDFRYMLGQLYMHKDAYKEARPLLEAVVAGNVESDVRSHAQKLLSVMSDIEQQEAKNAAARRARGLRPLETESGEGAAANQATDDPSTDLRAVLRIPPVGEQQVQGVLQSIDCDQNGLLFIVKTKDQVLRLRADSFQQVRRVTYTSDVRGTITCGARLPANPVVVCYLPGDDKKTKVDGIISSVEFVPADFSLTLPG
jgi:tetratricopeptide (TPR) repeat protein